jgi:multidrug resistance efflux pump
MADDLRPSAPAAPPVASRPRVPEAPPPTVGMRILPVMVTLIALGVAGLAAWAGWQAYMAAPWTRDGAVRAYVVTVAPEVSGRIVALPVSDNQFVHKGDVLLNIEAADYAIAVEQAQAALDQARSNNENAAREAGRRRQLSDLATSAEERQTYATTAAAAEATMRQASASLAKARLNLARTTIYAPVNGYVTNLLVRAGNYATSGQNLISIVDSDSYWIDGYFEETLLGDIHAGDGATIRLMGQRGNLRGHVDSLARGTAGANAQVGNAGLASVNPIFTWVRLAQRIPVRIHIDAVPPGLLLVAGQTASIQIEPSAKPRTP